MQKVAILLTIKNGDKYLNAQLKSLIEQKKVNIFFIAILIFMINLAF